MLSIVEDNLIDKVSLSEGDVILNGPPERLSGTLKLQNSHNSALRVKSLPLTPVGKKSALPIKPDLRINTKLEAGEQRLEEVTVSLARDTPPGTYEQYLSIGGEKRKITLIVQPTIEIGIHPSVFTFQNTSPGKVHQAIFTLSNMGNLPFQIPEIKHIAALDMDFLCRAFGTAFREEEGNGLVETLDRVTRKLKKGLPNWAGSKVAEAGEIVEPGGNVVVHLNITLPENTNPGDDYAGSVRFWDKDISFVVKSHTEPVKTRRNAK
jgi:hypothetical protein